MFKKELESATWDQWWDLKAIKRLHARRDSTPNALQFQIKALALELSNQLQQTNIKSNFNPAPKIPQQEIELL